MHLVLNVQLEILVKQIEVQKKTKLNKVGRMDGQQYRFHSLHRLRFDRMIQIVTKKDWRCNDEILLLEFSHLRIHSVYEHRVVDLNPIWIDHWNRNSDHWHSLHWVIFEEHIHFHWWITRSTCLMIRNLFERKISIVWGFFFIVWENKPSLDRPLVFRSERSWALSFANNEGGWVVVGPFRRHVRISSSSKMTVEVESERVKVIGGELIEFECTCCISLIGICCCCCCVWLSWFMVGVDIAIAFVVTMKHARVVEQTK